MKKSRITEEKLDNIIDSILYEMRNRTMISEAMKDGFAHDDINSTYNNEYNSWDSEYMRSRAPFNRIKDYCEKYFGEPEAQGSSRIVYQIDDNRVLKLAKNRAGVAQNKAEAACYVHSSNNNELFPKIFDQSPNNLWIDCEFVLPAKEDDFIECTNYDWYELLEIVDYLSKYTTLSSDNYYKKWIDSMLHKDNFIRELFQYIVVDQAPHGDIKYKRNWGMTNRNGYPRMVILDSGLTWQILKDFYWRPTSSSY